MVKLTELKCWRWLPGMRDLGETRLIEARESAHWMPQPDLNDPATQGAIVFGILAERGWWLDACEPGDVAMLKEPNISTGWLPLKEAIEAALRMEG